MFPFSLAALLEAQQAQEALDKIASDCGAADVDVFMDAVDAD